jgi:hypothetical protein
MHVAHAAPLSCFASSRVAWSVILQLLGCGYALYCCAARCLGGGLGTAATGWDFWPDTQMSVESLGDWISTEVGSKGAGRWCHGEHNC